MAAHQAPPSLGLSRQEHWSGLPFPSPMHESESEFAQSCLTQRSQGLQPTRLLCPWDVPGKNAGVGCHCLLPLQIKRNTCVKNHSVVPHFHSNKWTQIKKKKKCLLTFSGYCFHLSPTQNPRTWQIYLHHLSQNHAENQRTFLLEKYLSTETLIIQIIIIQ